jgi:hypothetical protein
MTIRIGRVSGGLNLDISCPIGLSKRADHIRRCRRDFGPRLPPPGHRCRCTRRCGCGCGCGCGCYRCSCRDQRSVVRLRGLVIGARIAITDQQGRLPVIGEKPELMNPKGVRIPPSELSPHDSRLSRLPWRRWRAQFLVSHRSGHQILSQNAASNSLPGAR